MVPGKYDIKIYKGSTWSISIEAKDIQGISMDFVDYNSMRMQIRAPFIKGMPTGSALLELTTANGRISLQSANTQILLTLSAAVTKALSFEEGVYDLEMVKDATVNPVAEEIVDKILRGSVTVIEEITV